MGHPSDGPSAQRHAATRVPEGDGAAGLDPHSAQRIAAALPARHHLTRQDHGRQSRLGRREDHRHYLQVGTDQSVGRISGIVEIAKV